MTPTDAREDVLVLAHNYTRPEVQDDADVVGDSLEMARFPELERLPPRMPAGGRLPNDSGRIRQWIPYLP